jgi:hypothetical protein
MKTPIWKEIVLLYRVESTPITDPLGKANGTPGVLVNSRLKSTDLKGFRILLKDEV